MRANQTGILVVVATATAMWAGTAASGQANCAGDCDGDGSVTVDEVITGVNIALGISPIESCVAFDRDGDGIITVDEVILAVSTALVGCESAPNPTATPRPPDESTPTPEPTPTPESTPTATATESPTALPQGTPTPVGQLFGGPIRGLFPHGLGDEFIYRVTRSDGLVFTETRRITADGSDGIFSVDTYEVAKLIRTEVYRDTGAALFEMSEVDHVDEVRTVCTPELLQLRTPLIVGVPSEAPSRCDLRSVRGNRFLGQVQQTTRVVPVAILSQVELPAGRFHDVVHIRAENTIGSSVEYFEIWIAPAIGIIRIEESSFGQVNRTAELSDGVVGGVSLRRP